MKLGMRGYPHYTLTELLLWAGPCARYWGTRVGDNDKDETYSPVLQGPEGERYATYTPFWSWAE